mmetsp:Transcript_64635/g.208129  ORF Transcript_64635/g.208129 Transcript_64635/m.208129 type:complete len:819 (+) Transcript_64635:59-2515(+)
MTMANNIVRCACVLAVLCCTTAVRTGPVDFDDPFAEVLPSQNQDPNTRIVAQQNGENSQQVHVMQEENRLLVSESVLDEQVDLREEERMEVECVGVRSAREVTDYATEQDEAEAEVASLRSFKPTEAEHKCLKLHERNSYLPSRFFGGDGFVNPPAFPERLGELVIEAVHHTDKQEGSNLHVVLELEGCTSCENDKTISVEWGGLLAVDEGGNYRKMYTGRYNTDNWGKGHFRRGDRKPIVARKRSQTQVPPVFDFASTPEAEQKYVKLYKYKYSSYTFDSKIEPEARELAEDAVDENRHVDQSFLAMHKQNVTELLQELREQTKHVPFNHKLEQVHINVYVCEEKKGGLACPDIPTESLIVHDGALVVASSRTTLLDQLGTKTSPCTYGPCRKKNGIEFKDRVVPYTMCSECGSSICKKSRTEPSPSLHSLSKAGRENWFNCIVERTYNQDGSVKMDLLQQSDDDTDPKSRPGHGLFVRTGGSPGYVEGHIDWHLTIQPQGHCEPFLQDVAYIGVGVDECDACPGGKVDVDVSAVLMSCDWDPKSGKLGNAGHCRGFDYLNYAHRQSSKKLYGISEDNRGGEGEGDDEWIFLNLAELQKQGVTHVMLVANIYGCQSGRTPSGGIQWQDLEGAFARIAGSSLNHKAFSAAETISYIDLDEMRGPAKSGAALAMFYLSDDEKLATPKELERTDSASGSGKAWKLLSTKRPISGNTVTQAMRSDGLQAFGLDRVPEATLEQQAQSMDLVNTMSTGQQVEGLTDTLEPVVHDSIELAENTHYSGESSDERDAKARNEGEFWQKFAATLPGGAPGTDARCVR